ncbi:MAG: SixA phosphatase family protein [Candidatus Promineifilaceae bacterium]
MKTLLLMRHAKSSWEHPALDDHDRPLNPRGERDAPRMGALIAAEGLVPDLILTSSARRAVETADAVAANCGYAGEVQTAPGIYAGGPAGYLAAVRGLTGSVERVLLIGHNPSVEQLLFRLTGQAISLPTAGLAQIELPIIGWKALSPQTDGALINLWLPKDLEV